MPTATNDDSGVSPATSPYPLISFAAGAGTESFLPRGVIGESYTPVSTGANTNETTLQTYTMPANTLSANGQRIMITAWGAFAANGNTKTVRLKFGATTIVVNTTTGAPNGTNWFTQHVFYRITATTQRRYGFSIAGSAVEGSNFSPDLTENIAAAITFLLTGQNGTAAAGDITCGGMMVEFIP